VLDANWDEVLEMPSHSPWPITLALALALLFTMLLLGHWVTAGAFGAVALLVLFAWQLQEPPEASAGAEP
jgi:O-antigen ligase